MLRFWIGDYVLWNDGIDCKGRIYKILDRSHLCGTYKVVLAEEENHLDAAQYIVGDTVLRPKVD